MSKVFEKGRKGIAVEPLAPRCFDQPIIENLVDAARESPASGPSLSRVPSTPSGNGRAVAGKALMTYSVT
ncbi:MAG: hypothetical protein CME16_06145 [Gemmatimonadetes bacterium]|nr:hypothetical protein [Gemmatimonadota bacterium]